MDFIPWVWEEVRYYVMCGVMSLFGRAAAHAAFTKRRTFRDNLNRLLLAMFCGMVAMLFMEPLGWPSPVKYGSVALVTFSGVDALFIGVVYLMKKLGMDVSETIEDAKTLYAALNDSEKSTSCSGKMLLDDLYSHGRITKDEYTAIFSCDQLILNELLDEGRINQDEYQKLRDSEVCRR